MFDRDIRPREMLRFGDRVRERHVRPRRINVDRHRHAVGCRVRIHNPAELPLQTQRLLIRGAARVDQAHREFLIHFRRVWSDRREFTLRERRDLPRRRDARRHAAVGRSHRAHRPYGGAGQLRGTRRPRDERWFRRRKPVGAIVDDGDARSAAGRVRGQQQATHPVVAARSSEERDSQRVVDAARRTEDGERPERPARVRETDP